MKKHFPVLLLLLVCAALLAGCRSDRSPEGIVRTELDLIKDLDEDTIRSFISYEDMMHIQSAGTDIGSETTEAIQLFFKNFDYKILSSEIKGDTASVTAEITNLDARSLARDMCKAVIAGSVSPDSSENPGSVSSYFTLLGNILTENSYETVTTKACFELVKSEDGWSVQTSEKLEDELVGGFVTYLHDQNLISPEEVVYLTMDALKELTPEEWVSYLGMNDIFATGNALGSKIDLALASQISADFSYAIREARIEDTSAQVDVEITSLDLVKVLSDYMEDLLDYASTTEAVRATDSELSDKTSQLLLDRLNANQDTASRTVTLNLINNGYNWDLQLDDAFTDALLGNLTEAMETFQASVSE